MAVYCGKCARFRGKAERCDKYSRSQARCVGSRWLGGLFVLAFGILGAECPMDGSVPAGLLTLAPGDLVYYNNPSDPLMFTTEADDGSMLSIYGEKNPDGTPAGVERLRYQSPDQIGTEEATYIDFDDMGRVINVQDTTGNTIGYEWQSATVATVTAVDAGGEVQTNFEIDFNEADGRKRTVDIDPSYSRIGREVTAEILPPVVNETTTVDPSVHSKRGATAQAGRSNEVRVNVMRCGAPVKGATVSVTYRFPNEPFAQFFLTKPVAGSSGLYVTEVPTAFDVNDIPLSSVCDFVTARLGDLCSVAGPFQEENADVAACTQLATAIDIAIAGPTGEGLGIVALCTTGSKALQTYCDTIDKSPGPGVPGNLAGEICAKVKEIQPSGPPIGVVQVELQAKAVIPGLDPIETEPMFVPAVGDFPELTIDFGGGTPAVAFFETTPGNPGPGQDYVARAELSCIPAGTEIRLGVVGSDGFTSSSNVVVEADNPNPIISLTVPGGAAMVQDQITVEAVGGIPFINPPFGAMVVELKREIAIVF